ncbi:MAG TPA: glycoside hydrolase family 76 protein [Trebonia sp.]|jgi:predicted alpha-1,6-mannanase (GH76 family)|nr:glycoside hydrolase family 76 protein [Trebonia sp.]
MAKNPPAGPGDRPAHLAAAVAALQEWHDERTGLWTIPPGLPLGRPRRPRGPGHAGWWNSANALYALIDYMAVTGTSDYLAIAAGTFDRHASTRFLNDYYDDEGWWALTWIGAHDLSRRAPGGQARERDYLGMARVIFADMEQGWDARTAGGGILWKKGRPGKNAVENELFLAIAARLYQRVPGPEREHYRGWLQRAGDWFHDNFIAVSPDGLIWDGMVPQPDATFSHAGKKQTWTYNQGIILGALGDMAESGLELAGREPLALARRIADAVLASPVLAPAGILTEWGAPDPGRSTDSPQFKGIFMRNLGCLAAYLGAPANAAYARFIDRTVAALLTSARNERGQFGYRWQGPFDTADSVRQAAALEALTAAVRAGVTLP